MALRINEKNGELMITGRIESKNAQQLIAHFKHLLEHQKKLTINIDKVQRMDMYAKRLLRELYISSILQNKLITVVGKGCKSLNAYFRQPLIVS